MLRARWRHSVITSYSIHYTKLYDIQGARSLDILEIDDPSSDKIDGYEYVYILQKKDGNNIVKRYIIEANSAELIDNNSVYANLTQLGINYPRSIKSYNFV